MVLLGAAVIAGSTVIEPVEPDAVQPFVSVAVTVYVVAEVNVGVAVGAFPKVLLQV